MADGKTLDSGLRRNDEQEGALTVVERRWIAA
jgi:hypothetical protein